MKTKTSNRPIIYSPCTFVCHGLCEVTLASHIRGQLAKPIMDYSANNGKTSIQVHHLVPYLDSLKDFKSLKNYLVANGVDKNDVDFFLSHHWIFPIMDLDDCSDEEIERYQKGALFKDRWYAPYIKPLYFYPNLDSATNDLGFPISSRHKPEQYDILLTRDSKRFYSALAGVDPHKSNFKEAIDILGLL